jgi:hypothetical protein
MGINAKMTAVAVLTLAIAGCTIGDTENANQPPTTTPTPSEQTGTTAKTPFPDPVVSPQTDVGIKANNPGLIEPTKPDLRAELVPKGRPDPFGEIIKPILLPDSGNQKQAEVPKLPPLPTPAIPPQTGRLGQAGQARQPQGIAQGGRNNGQSGTNNASLPKPKPLITPVVPKVLPQVVAKAPVAPVLPPAPKPEAAQAILVSGVVLIGREPKAIIKVPDEPSRYVQAGQRLPSGVLIKRIEMNGGSNPIVILEQYGIEVAKAVGEKPITEPSKTASAGNAIAMSTSL